MSDTLIDAIEVFKLTPEKLTGEQIALLRKADPALGQEARQRRAQAKMQHVLAGIKQVVEHEIKRATAQATADLQQRVLELEATVAAQRKEDEIDAAR